MKTAILMSLMLFGALQAQAAQETFGPILALPLQGQETYSALFSAVTYNCEVLRNEKSQVLLNDAIYDVVISGEKVTLLKTMLGPKKVSTSTPMLKVKQEVENAVYQANGMTVTTMLAPNGGHLESSMLLSTEVDGVEYSAECLP